MVKEDVVYIYSEYYLSTKKKRKAMTNLDSILKSRDISWPTKVCLVKAVAFPVVMYGCELDHKEG